MKKLLSMLFVLLLLFSSCSNAGDVIETTEAADTTTEAETTAEMIETEPLPDPLTIYEENKTTYQVVYRDDDDSLSSQNAAGLAKKLSSLGFSMIRTKSDLYKKESPEILIGPTKRPESTEVLESLPENSYAITIKNGSLVIVGTSDTLTALALYKFEEMVLSNPERCADGKLMVTAEDIVTVTDETVYTLKEMITLGFGISAISKKVGLSSAVGECRVGQGACSDGSYVYLCMRNSDDTATVISKHDIQTGERVMHSEPLDLGHANDATFDTKNNRIVVAHGTSQGRIVSLINPDTLELIEDINIPVAAGAISYNAKRDCYASSSGGKTLNILSSEFQLLKGFTRTDNTGYTAQGMGSDDDYLFFPMSGKSDNILVVYNWEGQYVTTIKIPMTEESESLFWVNGNYYVAYHVGGESFYLTTFVPVYSE